MYYEIEGLYEMPAVIFDEDRIVTGKKNIFIRIFRI